MRHRLSIGTIVSESAMKVQFVRGRTLGSVEENFIARLRPGDHFTFAGRTLEFVRVRGMVAYVRKSARADVERAALVGRADADLARARGRASVNKLDEARRGDLPGPGDGGRAADPGAAGGLVAPARRRTSCWSSASTHARGSSPLLLSDRGTAGARGARGAVRLSDRPARPDLLHARGQRLRPGAPLGRSRADRGGDRGRALLPAHLLHDIPASLNAAELARRQFREIARVAGLIFQGYPGVNKSVKQVQASSELLYDVFARYDPRQPAAVPGPPRSAGAAARAEPARRARSSAIAAGRITVVDVERPTPLAFPLLVDRAREQVSSEKLADRIRRMAAPLERAADARPLRPRPQPRIPERRMTDVEIRCRGGAPRAPPRASAVLAPHRARWWRRISTGAKGATFRAAGIPIPVGATSDDLARLDEALHRTGAPTA